MRFPSSRALDDVVGREPAGLQLLRVEVDHDAGGPYRRRPPARPPRRPGRARLRTSNAGQVLDLLLASFGLLTVMDAERQRAGRVERHDDRRQRVGRQVRDGRERQRVGHRQRGGRVDVVAEVELDDAHAGHRPRLDRLHARRLVDPPLDAVGDARSVERAGMPL